MNTNPKAIRVLCYGDSNTWGDPALGKPRFAANVRWPGRLQDLLGPNYEIIEEGLCGRTTDIDDPKREGRNGKTYLISCLETQKPIDLFILLLGTNDFKERFNRSAKDVVEGIKGLLELVKNSGAAPNNSSPNILLLSPLLVKNNSELSKTDYKGGPEKSKELGLLLEKVAEKQKCLFLNLASIEPGIDGGHLSAEGHAKVAELVYNTIKKNV